MEKTLYRPQAKLADCNFTDAAENCLGSYTWAEIVPYYCERGNNAWLEFDVRIHDPYIVDIYPIEGWRMYREGYIHHTVKVDLYQATVCAYNIIALMDTASPFRKVIIHPDHKAHKALIDSLMDIVLDDPYDA